MERVDRFAKNGINGAYEPSRWGILRWMVSSGWALGRLYMCHRIAPLLRDQQATNKPDKQNPSATEKEL